MTNQELKYPPLSYTRSKAITSQYEIRKIASVLYLYLFYGTSHRDLDNRILNLDSAITRGYQSMSILHHFGIVEGQKQMLKGMRIQDGISALLQSDDEGYRQIGEVLDRFYQQELLLFRKTLPGMNKEIGKSQYKDGIAVNKEFFPIFNPETSEHHVARGESREVLVWFNGTIFDASYRYDNTEDESVTHHRIGFRKALIDEFLSLFPDKAGGFILYKGADESHFVIESDVSEPLPEADEGEGALPLPAAPAPFSPERLVEDIRKSQLLFQDSFITRFAALLLTKPFLLLTGLTGSGKTQIALTFAKWLCADSSQYAFIPVGSDWTNREPLLGYPNALEEGKYVKPDNGVLDLLLNAGNNPDIPHFLILDEMNLSHVERYFADFLSSMESKQSIYLHAAAGSLQAQDGGEVPPSIELFPNLFIIGTVNIDETTYMFSPKVLDRAGVLEFRVSRDDMERFLISPSALQTDAIAGNGALMGEDFVRMAAGPAEPVTAADDLADLTRNLLDFFETLKTVSAEFGYRTTAEIFRYTLKSQ